ncbi:MAG TPA: hypothetical protein VLW50_03515 [Streptosporangiaceae bacterium]|nr:hypothetical protein [Streptosporangiaceae bacterium]
MSDQSREMRGSHRRPVLTGLGVAVVGVAVVALSPAGQALASPNAAPAAPAPSPAPVAPATTSPSLTDDPPSGSTDLTTTVGPAISLVDNTPSFSLDGNIGDTPVADAAVSLTVTTNNSNGYNVTVTPVTVGGALPTGATGNLVSETKGNNDTISVGDISVEETPGVGVGASGSPGFQALTPAGLQVYTQSVASAAGGDTLSNDYEYNTGIPNVANGTYTVQLDYLATANAV